MRKYSYLRRKTGQCNYAMRSRWPTPLLGGTMRPNQGPAALLPVEGVARLDYLGNHNATHCTWPQTCNAVHCRTLQHSRAHSWILALVCDRPVENRNDNGGRCAVVPTLLLIAIRTSHHRFNMSPLATKGTPSIPRICASLDETFSGQLRSGKNNVRWSLMYSAFDNRSNASEKQTHYIMPHIYQ